jgi:2-polyprenyl-6-hydroxyphenyl methylase/3-demethylubiquinone-9 3-methyltransferase
MEKEESYYRERLAAEKLRGCYELAPARIRQYLDAEVNHILQKIKSIDIVLELGCGYGRIIPYLARKASFVTGIDISPANLRLAQEYLVNIHNCRLYEQNAIDLKFQENTFDVVLCIQNGISAFHIDKRKLVLESCRVTKPEGIILFSTYSEKIWYDRLNWFQLQAEAGLIGEIDYKQTRDGIIVCKDGFHASTVNADEFLSLTSELNAHVSVEEVDESSLFCEIVIHEEIQ